MPAHKPPATDATLAALHKAVLAAPDDDLPRLVYADRLDELGDHLRAEFIRLQIHVANTNPWDEGHADALVRSEVLLQKHSQDWQVEESIRELTGVKSWGPRATHHFARGFPDLGYVRVEKYASARRATLKQYPLGQLVLLGGTRGTIHRAGEIVAELAPQSLSVHTVSGNVFAALAAGPSLPSVRKVALVGDHRATPQEVEWLAGCGAFPNVEEVNFRSADSDKLLPFIRGLRWPRVRRVSLTGPFDAEEVNAVASAGWLAKLEHLALENELVEEWFDLDEDHSLFMDLDPDPVLRSGRVGALKSLKLQGFMPSPALADLRKLGRLESLAIAPYHAMTTAEYRAVLGPAGGDLRSLELPYLTSGVDAAELAGWVGRHTGLQSLFWGGIGLGTPAVKALAETAITRTLRRFRTVGLALEEATAEALTSGRPWVQLAELLFNPGGHDGRAVAELIDHPHFAGLTHLIVAYGRRPGELWRKLANSKTVGRFHKLTLGFAITDKQLNTLLDNPEVCKIGHLALPHRVKIGRKTQRRYEQVFGVPITRDG